MATPTKLALAKIDYVILHVRSAEKAIAFYRDVLGLKVKMQEGGWVELETAGTVLALNEEKEEAFPAEPKGPTAVVFGVDDIQATYEHLKQEGVTFDEEPKKVCDGPNGQIGLSADFKDPDGNTLSLFAMVKGK